MPRGPRLDTPGALHHVMVRGLERRTIFRDDQDRAEFLKRLSAVHERTGLGILAWALLPNHFHLLVRSPHGEGGATPRSGLSTAMRQLMTGYAGAFNRRHRRVGPLVQGRYKSVLVEEEPYLLELVRYLHLNPLRAGVVENLTALDRYPWSGHSALMGRFTRPWQATAEVLERFGSTLRPARSRYREFMRAGVSRGRRPELQGGGLRRSAGGWEAVALLCRGREQWAADERILGSGPFVEQILRETAPPAPRFPRAQLLTVFPDLVQRCGAAFGVDPGEIYGASRRRVVVRTRAVVSYLAVSHLGLSAAAVAGTLGVTTAVVLCGVHRGRRTLAMQQLTSGELLLSPKRKV